MCCELNETAQTVQVHVKITWYILCNRHTRDFVGQINTCEIPACCSSTIIRLQESPKQQNWSNPVTQNQGSQSSRSDRTAGLSKKQAHKKQAAVFNAG